MPETSGESAVDAVPTFESFPKHPKRVILRLRVNEFDGRNPTEFDHAIMAYLASAGRPVDELTQRIHHSHIEPFQPPEMKQRSFHIVLDIEKDMLSDPDFERVEHEVHRVHRAKNVKSIAFRIQPKSRTLCDRCDFSRTLSIRGQNNDAHPGPMRAPGRICSRHACFFYRGERGCT
ncbi:hypothetical protein BDFG_03788 [Blastomyces dermatitidis ATCC 26199]|nr:hypothetical protein BDFG_03788 [Blastomyces dermatitidis ATCC 26199]